MSANELIGRFRAGDSEALNQLYIESKPKLLAICRQFTKEESVAEDLLHDAFVVIITSLDRLKDTSKLDAWMASIVHNVGYQYQKHLAKEQAAMRQLTQEDRDTEEPMLTPDYGQLQSLVDLLPQGYQQIFRLSVFEGLSHQEIGQLLGIAPHSSSSQLSHAKRMLRLLIKQSWVLILLLIAVPAAIWQFLHKPTSEPKMPTARKTPPMPQPEPEVETLQDTPVYAAVHPKPQPRPDDYRTEAVIRQDTIPYYNSQPADTLTEVAQDTAEKDSLPSRPIMQPAPLPSQESPVYTKPKADTWNIRLAYNGQLGQRDDYLAASTIGNGSFEALSNSNIPSDRTFDNWLAYNYYLNYSPSVSRSAETHSLMNLATLNTITNSVFMETRYEHQLPLTIQLQLSRQIGNRLSAETGLSYTRLSSTNTTGGSLAYIEERQRLHYLGIPLRLGYQWYNHAHLSLYTSAGVMLEFPIRGTVDVSHIANGINTFSNKVSLCVPLQWSVSFGLGLQYDLTPHVGLFAEPSLQYFFNDGSDLKSYRTEHPFTVTLPIGLRFHW